jgi:mannose-1-phosphate guanylyltransferase
LKPVTKAYLLAAGLGKRLRPITDTIPKCLVPIKGVCLCDYWFESFQRHGITHALMNTHYLAEQVREHVSQLRTDLDIQLFHEPELLGSAGTVRASAAFVEGEDDFFVVYGDNLSAIDLRAMAEFHQAHGGALTMALFHAANPTQCGIATMDCTGRIVAFEEKPKTPKGDWANAGVYVCSKEIVPAIPAKPVADFGYDVLPQFVDSMYGFPLECFHLDIGSPESYREAQEQAPDLMAR